jgi:hypothetical protein
MTQIVLLKVTFRFDSDNLVVDGFKRVVVDVMVEDAAAVSGGLIVAASVIMNCGTTCERCAENGWWTMDSHKEA